MFLRRHQEIIAEGTTSARQHVSLSDFLTETKRLSSIPNPFYVSVIVIDLKSKPKMIFIEVTDNAYVKIHCSV